MTGAQLELHAGDITRLALDAIVNAANSRLVPGGGVDGAINRAAGPALAEAMARLGGCPTGEARLTPGFRLPARFVIHAVGPVWQGGGQGEDALLAAAYRSSLALALQHGLVSLAFPAISTGVYGYPLARACDVAVGAVEDWTAANPGLQRVVFCVFGAEAEAAYRDRLSR
jgi:O-acetyl-ADP-ribose deacetylase (regulator of RNase III)